MHLTDHTDVKKGSQEEVTPLMMSVRMKSPVVQATCTSCCRGIGAIYDSAHVRWARSETCSGSAPATNIALRALLYLYLPVVIYAREHVGNVTCRSEFLAFVVHFIVYAQSFLTTSSALKRTILLFSVIRARERIGCGKCPH